MADETEVIDQGADAPSTETAIPDPPAFDPKALEAKVEAGLKSLTNDGDEPVAQQEAKTDDDAQEPAASDEANVSAVVETPASTEKAPTLPAAYVRTLKAYEWTDEEISEAAKQPNFLATAAKIHANRNKEISEWAAAGRRARSDQTPAPTATEVTKKQATAAAQTLAALDLDALKKQYGDDGLLDKLVTPINQAIAVIQTLQQEAAESRKVSQQSELDMLSKQIEGFFGDKELEPYKEVYGALDKGLNDEQLKQRNVLLETADALMVGAKMQNRALSLKDALTLAHDSVSSGFQKQAIRTEIKQGLKTREKGISFKPSGRKPVDDGKPMDRKALESKVAAGLAATFATS